MPNLDREYFLRHAQAARALAEKTGDASVRALHERMARDYAELADIAGPTVWSSGSSEVHSRDSDRPTGGASDRSSTLQSGYESYTKPLADERTA